MNRIKLVVASAALAFVGASVANALNTLAVVGPDLGLNGTEYAMRINVETGAPSPTNSVYVVSEHPNNETHMKILFRIKLELLDGAASGGGRTMRILQLGDDASAATPHKILFIQRQVGTGNWRLIAWGRNDAGTYLYLGSYFLGAHHSTADIQVSCEWTREVSASSNDGILTCSKVGTAQIFTVSNVDDNSYQGDFVQFGFLDFDLFGNNGSGGSLDLDEYESYR